MRSRSIALLLSTLPILATLACQTQTVVSPASNDEIVRYADELFSKSYPADEPGAAVLIAKDGKILLRKGYGLANLELGVPVKPDMVFEIASVTKQFTAAAILLLQERGKLSVDDEITRYLTDYPAQGQKITIDHLLTHRSGIPDYTGLPEWWPRMREDLTVQQLMSLFKDKPLAFNPGERTAYSNSGYVVLGAILEKVSGKSYEDFIEQEIFAPLGMKQSRYGHNDEVVTGGVTGYDLGENGFNRAMYMSLTHPYAAGALMSTVDDLALWTDALYGGKLLKPASLERMTTPAKLPSGRSTGTGYGLGIASEEGKRIFEHGGGAPGFTTYLLYSPDQHMTVAVLSNAFARQPMPDTLAFQVMMKALGKPVEERKAMDLDPARLDEYVGVYRFDGDFTQTVAREENKLFLELGPEKHEIQAASRDDFFFREGVMRVHFRRDAQGKINGMDFMPGFGPGNPGVPAVRTGK